MTDRHNQPEDNQPEDNQPAGTETGGAEGARKEAGRAQADDARPEGSGDARPENTDEPTDTDESTDTDEPTDTDESTDTPADTEEDSDQPAEGGAGKPAEETDKSNGGPRTRQSESDRDTEPSPDSESTSESDTGSSPDPDETVLIDGRSIRGPQPRSTASPAADTEAAHTEAADTEAADTEAADTEANKPAAAHDRAGASTRQAPDGPAPDGALTKAAPAEESTPDRAGAAARRDATGSAGPSAETGSVPPAGSPEGRNLEDGVTRPTGTGSVEAPATEPSGWRRLLATVRSRRSPATTVIIFALCGLLGFFAVVQLRLQGEDNTFRNARQTDLIRILDDLGDRSERLQDELRDLDARRRELQSGSDRSQTALEEAEQRRETLGILAGTIPAKGPGILLTIRDPQRRVDAAVLLDALQELRDAGAEAVQINDVRVVASTDFLDAQPGKVRIDGRVVAAPYQFKVIGDPDTLSPALRIPGGVFAVLADRGATAQVRTRKNVVISAVRPEQPPEFARPDRSGT